MGYSRADSLTLSRFFTLRGTRVLPAPVRPVCRQSDSFAIVGRVNLFHVAALLRRHSDAGPVCVVVAIVMYKRPGHTCGLVRQCDDDNIGMSSFQQCINPATQGSVFPFAAFTASLAPWINNVRRYASPVRATVAVAGPTSSISMNYVWNKPSRASTRWCSPR